MADRREEEKKEEVQLMEEERTEEQRYEVPCSCRICKYQHEHTNERGENYKKHNTPTA